MLDAGLRPKFATKPVQLQTREGLVSMAPGAYWCRWDGKVVSWRTQPIHELVSSIARLRNTLIAFERPENPSATVVAIPENSLLCGYASVENQQKLSGKAMTIAERHGRGSVILFSDNPNFRAYFFGTNKMFMRSLFFSKGFNRPRGS